VFEIDAKLSGEKYRATSEELQGTDRGLKAAEERPLRVGRGRRSNLRQTSVGIGAK